MGRVIAFTPKRTMTIVTGGQRFEVSSYADIRNANALPATRIYSQAEIDGLIRHARETAEYIAESMQPTSSRRRTKRGR